MLAKKTPSKSARLTAAAALTGAAAAAAAGFGIRPATTSDGTPEHMRLLANSEPTRIPDATTPLPAAFGGTHQTIAISKPLPDRIVELIAHNVGAASGRHLRYETVNWRDASGIDVGIQQWNQKDGSLYVLFQRMHHADAQLFAEIFKPVLGAGYVTSLTTPEELSELSFAPHNALGNALSRALRSPVFQKVQRDLSRQMVQRSIRLARSHGYRSEAALALVSDLGNQLGEAATVHALDQVQAQVGHIHPANESRALHELVRLTNWRPNGAERAARAQHLFQPGTPSTTSGAAHKHDHSAMPSLKPGLPLSNPELAKQMERYLVHKGLSPVAAAGIVGNLQQESNLSPGEPGGFLAQWEGPRQSALLQSAGTDNPTWQQQLDYMWKELTGAPGAAEDDSHVLALLQAAKTPAEAASVFSNRYERPQIPDLSKRQSYANTALSLLPNGQRAGSPVVPSTPAAPAPSPVPSFHPRSGAGAEPHTVAPHAHDHTASGSTHRDRQLPAGTMGVDVSYPQQGMDIRNSNLYVVGLNYGYPFSVNPALPQQWGAAQNAKVSAVYINTDNAKGLSGQAAYDYGRNLARYSLDVAHRHGIGTHNWWLDVETTNSWLGSPADNAQVVRGALDALDAAGIHAGVYATSYQWGQITGDAQILQGRELWVAGTPANDPGVLCGETFGGATHVRMTQVFGTSTTPDQDYVCPR